MKVIESSESAESLEDPQGKAWEGLAGETLELAPAPTDGQPSRYVSAAYGDNGPQGAAQVAVTAVRSKDGSLLLRLEWADDDADLEYGGRGFPDGAAVMFPAGEDAPLSEMGSPEQPVGLWYWRPDLKGECEVLGATGLGTVERGPTNGVSAKSRHADGRWSVVFRAASGATPAKVAFAVWEGGAGQRGGLKSVTDVWQDLEVVN